MSNPPPLHTLPTAPPAKKSGCLKIFLIVFAVSFVVLFALGILGGILGAAKSKEAVKNFPQDKPAVIARIENAGQTHDADELESIKRLYGDKIKDADFLAAVDRAQSSINAAKASQLAAEAQRKAEAAAKAQQEKTEREANQSSAAVAAQILAKKEQQERDTPSNITWKEIDSIYSLSSKTTDIVKDEKWKSYKGKRIRWKGTVREVQKDILGDYQILVQMKDSSFGADIILYPRKNQMDAMFKLSKDDPITFEATLVEWGSLMPITAKEGVIVK